MSIYAFPQNCGIQNNVVNVDNPVFKQILSDNGLCGDVIIDGINGRSYVTTVNDSVLYEYEISSADEEVLSDYLNELK